MTYVVSGLPRSGTSMMMRMLAAGGAPVLADDERPADADNRRGYFELAAVKRTAYDTSWVTAAEGRCVKVISPLLRYLPADHRYRVILMRRSLDQVVRSQRAMLERLRRVPDDADEALARRMLAEHLAELEGWLATAHHMSVLGVSYERVVARPAPEIGRLLRFLELELDAAAMATAVEPELQRQR